MLDEWLSQRKDREESIAALTIWRENRGGGKTGMQSVLNVIHNRVKRKRTGYEIECRRPWQFSSISDPKDPQLNRFPMAGDKAFSIALGLAYLATADVLVDLTNGSTVYYNPAGIAGERYATIAGETVKFPVKWNLAALHYQGEIANHLFFVEN